MSSKVQCVPFPFNALLIFGFHLRLLIGIRLKHVVKRKLWSCGKVDLKNGLTRRRVSRFNWDRFYPSVRHSKSGDVMQPSFHFPTNVCII